MSRFSLCLTVCLLVTPTAFADESAPASMPAAPRADAKALKARWRLGRNLVISGATLFAAAYLVSIISVPIGSFGSSFCNVEPSNSCGGSQSYLWGLLPIAGPWLQLGYSPGHGAATVAYYAMPGIVQAGGMAMLIAGLVIRGRAAARLPLVGAYSTPEGAGVWIGGRF